MEFALAALKIALNFGQLRSQFALKFAPESLLYFLLPSPVEAVAPGVKLLESGVTLDRTHTGSIFSWLFAMTIKDACSGA